MPGDLKVAVDFRDSDHTISLCAVEEGFDMHSEVLRDLDLPQVLERIPAFVEEARAKWATEPNFPTYKKPRASRKTAGKAAAPEKPADPPAADGAPGGTLEESKSTTTTVTAGDLPLLAAESTDPEPKLPEEGETMTTTQPEAETPDTQDGNGAETPAAQNGNGAEAPAAQNGGGGGKWVYKVLLDGKEHSFEHPHAALLALGVTQEDIDKHKYWHRHDRLPKNYQEQIQKIRGD